MRRGGKPLPVSGAKRPAEGPGVPLFAATTFASALLIFLVQPLVGKRILPWFGGVPSVWSLCLAFYQTTLFAGYAYAHLLIRCARPAHQLAIHAAVIAAAALSLPVLPGDAWKPEGTGDPTAAILAMLIANVALPFLALAAAGPLVAVWFSHRYSSRSPYPLYAVSNLGSLIALVAYPFLLEPRLSVSAVGQLWSGAFVATGTAVIACAALAWRAGPATSPTSNEEATATDPRPGRVALWVLLAACAVAILMGVTNQLCLDVASVPFLWIVPLAIYLVTLILCFGSARVYRRTPYTLLAGLAFSVPTLTERVGIQAALLESIGGKVPFQAAIYGTLLFATCMVLHGELYRLRPRARSLSAFYLCTSGGGALGGLAVGLGAPRVFDGFYELPIGLASAVFLLLAACRDDASGWLGRAAPKWRLGLTASLVAIGVAIAGVRALDRPALVLHQERSFFGVLRVEQHTSDQEGPFRALMHGSTLHGLQIEQAEDRPTSYFGINTGIGLALSQPESDGAAEIGVIGLGAGTLAAYGRAGDHLRFFEIDPAVIRLALDQRYFTFLARSKALISIIEGDGRISLARERARNAPRFDYLIIDAFSSDAVPVHLLTREALALYLDSLEPDGLLGIHVSSRYFDLMPVLSRLAADAGLHAVLLESPRTPRYLSSASRWAMLSRDEQRIRSLASRAEQRRRALSLSPDPTAVRRPSPEMIARAPLWTDDYTDLLSVYSPSHAGSPLDRLPRGR